MAIAHGAMGWSVYLQLWRFLVILAQFFVVVSFCCCFLYLVKTNSKLVEPLYGQTNISDIH